MEIQLQNTLISPVQISLINPDGIVCRVQHRRGCSFCLESKFGRSKQLAAELGSYTSQSMYMVSSYLQQQ